MLCDATSTLNAPRPADLANHALCQESASFHRPAKPSQGSPYRSLLHVVDSTPDLERPAAEKARPFTALWDCPSLRRYPRLFVIRMELSALPPWVAPTDLTYKPRNGPLKKAFDACFSTSEILASIAGRVSGKPGSNPPELEARRSVLNFASDLDAGYSRFLFQDEPGQTVCITVDVLDRPRVAPDSKISASRNDDLPGPLVPVRYHVARLTSADLDAEVQLLRKSAQQVLSRPPPCRDLREVMAVKAWSPEEVEIILGWLTASTALLSPSSVRAFEASALSCKGAFKIGFLGVPQPPNTFVEEPADYPCSATGCPNRTTQRCAGCAGACYCSRACQRAHWPTHKRVCAKTTGTGTPGAPAAPAPAPGGRQSVLLSMASDLAPDQVFFTLPHSGAPSGQRVTGGTGAPVNVHGDAVFLVKVQRPLGGSPGMPAFVGGAPLMLYDQRRSFTLQVSPAAAPALDACVRDRGLLGGAKAYLEAKREGDRLRVFVDAPVVAAARIAW